MRVLMVSGPVPTAARPGTLAFVARQIESLRGLGINVDVVEVRGAPKLKYAQAMPALWRHLATADLVHAHFGYCGWMARMQVSKPVVISFLGDDLLGTPDANGRATVLSRFAIHVNRWLARMVDAVIVKSAEMARVIAPVSAHIVPNGVDLEAFQPMDTRRARQILGWPEVGRYVLFPGYPDIPRKGFALARAATENATSRLGEELRLVPLCDVPLDRVPLYMNACDALIMTSLWEGSPNAIKEAMACNLPVVSVPVGDVPDLLANVSESTVCNRNVDELGTALARVIRCPPVGNGRATLVRRQLDLESVARTITRIYESVLAGHK